MRALRIVGEGLTTSFRYPHFMHGIQPTFEMPPPATIYGHICSALGRWVSPKGLEFAYCFTREGMFSDIEHNHMVSRSTGRLPGTNMPKVLEGGVSPFKRMILFKPRLVLYINKPELEEAFRSPKYPVVLGRSQDLFTYTDVQIVTLVESEQAYIEHTILPHQMVYRVARGYAQLMPRFIEYDNRRRPTFAQYLVVNRRVHSDDFLDHEKLASVDRTFWTDPDSPEYRGARRGLFFLTLVDEDCDHA